MRLVGCTPDDSLYLMGLELTEIRGKRATLTTTCDVGAIVESVGRLLAHPDAHSIESVIINPLPSTVPTHRDFLPTDLAGEPAVSLAGVADPWAHAEELARLLPAQVSHVGFGGWPAPLAIAYVRMPSFSTLSEHFGMLRKLELTGACRDHQGSLALPLLRDLEVRFAYAAPHALDAVVRSTLPALERLAVWLGGIGICRRDGPPVPGHMPAHELDTMQTVAVWNDLSDLHLQEFVDRIPPSVQELALCFARESCGPLYGACDAIAASSRIRTLRRLDLAGGSLGDDFVRELIEMKAAFAHLEQLNLSRNRISPRYQARLLRAMPNVAVGDQSDALPKLSFRIVVT